MMRSIGFIFCLAVLVIACNHSKDDARSTHPYADYFYPFDTIPRVYGYRDVAGGLEEQFKRVYAVEDSEGKHIIVETYVDYGRLRDALNFNLDSLKVLAHKTEEMLKKTKGTMYVTNPMSYEKSDFKAVINKEKALLIPSSLIFCSSLFILKKLNVFNQNIFNRVYAQNYSYKELVFIFNR